MEVNGTDGTIFFVSIEPFVPIVIIPFIPFVPN